MAKQIDLTVARRPLDRRAADMLREQILGGAFPPGHRLVEAGLAEQLSVSRGTVRAALSELAHEGLVQQVAYTKWLVPELSAHDVWELYTLRSSLEGLAAGLAAAQAKHQKTTALEEAFARLETAVAGQRRGAAAAADSALHKTIVALSGHRRLVEHYRIIEQQVQRYIASSNALLADPGDLVTQHARRCWPSGWPAGTISPKGGSSPLISSGWRATRSQPCRDRSPVGGRRAPRRHRPSTDATNQPSSNRGKP